jgi:regulator of replication initiation timing
MTDNNKTVYRWSDNTGDPVADALGVIERNKLELVKQYGYVPRIYKLGFDMCEAMLGTIKKADTDDR